jgi:hypothetical protein
MSWSNIEGDGQLSLTILSIPQLLLYPFFFRPWFSIDDPWGQSSIQKSHLHLEFPGFKVSAIEWLSKIDEGPVLGLT